MIEITGPHDGLLDDRLTLGLRGGGEEAEVEWRARFTDDAGHVWRAVAEHSEDLAGEWAASAMHAGTLPALASLRPVTIEVRAELEDGRAARRSFDRRLLGEGVRRRRWRDGLTATLCLPAEPAPRGTVLLEESPVAALAAPLLASRGVLTLLVADGLELARERLATLPAATGEPLHLTGRVPSPFEVEDWDALLAQVGARPR